MYDKRTLYRVGHYFATTDSFNFQAASILMRYCSLGVRTSRVMSVLEKSMQPVHSIGNWIL